MSNRIPMLRRSSTKTQRERPYRDSRRSPRGDVTGYETLHPTRGWKRVSFRRLRFHQTIMPA